MRTDRLCLSVNRNILVHIRSVPWPSHSVFGKRGCLLHTFSPHLSLRPLQQRNFRPTAWNTVSGSMAAFSPAHQYEERVSSASNIPIDRLPQELSQPLNNRIILFEWNKGTPNAFDSSRVCLHRIGVFPGSVTAVAHVENLQDLPVCDLRIL
jgi:hypothetical protein